jgi:hypothetical protein
MAEEVAAAPPAVQESLVEAKLFGKWDFSDVEVRQPAALFQQLDSAHNENKQYRTLSFAVISIAAPTYRSQEAP